MMLCDDSTLMWYIMSKKEEIGYRERENLISYCGSIEEVFELSTDQIAKLDFLSVKAKEALTKRVDIEKEQEYYNRMISNKIHFICLKHDTYPTKLKRLYDPPHFLYYIGQLPEDNLPSVAVIGARNCTTYGMDLAKELSKELASYGVQIISGLARGIDGCSHKGALMEKGKTYGIIGHGVDSCYPRENIELYHEVALSGGIISEYPIGSKALAFHFPVRNRIIAGLSDGILVIEAKEKSGTLITVDCGLEQGKDIFAIPGRITEPLSRGCNRLIQNGAKLVLSVQDIIEEMASKYPNLLLIEEKTGQLTMSLEENLTKEEKLLIKLMSKESVTFESLLAHTNYSTSKLMECIYSLKIKNIIREVEPQKYRITNMNFER